MINNHGLGYHPATDPYEHDLTVQQVQEIQVAARDFIRQASAYLRPATTKEIQTVAAIMLSNYPPDREKTKEQREAKWAIFVDVLKDIPFISLIHAVKEILRSPREWMPVPGVIRDRAMEDAKNLSGSSFQLNEVLGRLSQPMDRSPVISMDEQKKLKSMVKGGLKEMKK